MAWKVDYEAHVRTEIKTQLDEGVLTKDDLKALAKWVDEIESNGLGHVRPTIGTTIHWKPNGLGYDQRVFLCVVRVTGTHNYRN